MLGKFQFDLISPEKMIFSDKVEDVNIPGSEGFFSVMAGHVPLVTRVVPGIVNVSKEEGHPVSYVVFGGFVEVGSERTSLLAEIAVPLDKLDKQDVQDRINKAKETLKDAKTEETRNRLEEYIYHMSNILSSAHA